MQRTCLQRAADPWRSAAENPMMPQRPDEETIGQAFEELHHFLCEESRGLAEYMVCPAITKFRLAQCRCGSVEFHLRASDDIVRRLCPACGHEQFVCEPEPDEAESEWSRFEVATWSCRSCGSNLANLGAGLGCFDFRPDSPELYLGVRCTGCGRMSLFPFVSRGGEEVSWDTPRTRLILILSSDTASEIGPAVAKRCGGPLTRRTFLLLARSASGSAEVCP